MRFMRAIRRWLGTRSSHSDFHGITTIPFDAGLGEY